MVQLLIIFISIIIAYIISLTSGIYSIFKKEHYPINILYINLIIKAFSFKFIHNLLNTSTREERRELLQNLVVSEYGIFIKNNFSVRIRASEVITVVASMTCFLNLTVPRQASLKRNEVQQIVKIPNDTTTYIFKS